MKILVSGANGFVGKSLCAELIGRNIDVCAAVRIANSFTEISVGQIDGQTNWTKALQGVDVVIHLAARAHVMLENAVDPSSEFRKVNVSGAENLARQAALAGVKRLVYVSSIKVNGERNDLPFKESDEPSPQDPYGISKNEGEQALHRVALDTGMDVVVVRPPLVYGVGVKGNFIQMLKVLADRTPLPLASVCNQRSLVYVENLSDALIACAMHPEAAGQTYLVSDGEDISTPGLLRQLGDEIGRPARLFPCPPALLKWAGVLLGRSAQVERLMDSLQVDSGKIRRELNWTPPYTLQQGLQATAEWYRNAYL